MVHSLTGCVHCGGLARPECCLLRETMHSRVGDCDAYFGVHNKGAVSSTERADLHMQ